MFGPNNNANPTGTAGGFDFRKKLLAALHLTGKKLNTSPYKRIAELFYADKKAAIAILPYVTPKLRTLEISGEVSVPFQFVIETSAGKRVPLPEPQPTKAIESKLVMPLPVKQESEVVVSPIKNDKCSGKPAPKHITTKQAKQKVKQAKAKRVAKRATML